MKVVVRWFWHFSGVLNVTSQLCQEFINGLPSLKTCTDLDEYYDGVFNVWVGYSKIEESLWHVRDYFRNEIVWWISFSSSLFGCIPEGLRDGEVFEEWRNAMVTPIPKRGDLSWCHNWRRISLLDVAGKLLGWIIHEQLQVIA